MGATRATTTTPAPLLRRVHLDRAPHTGYPFNLPVVRHLAERDGVDLDAPVILLAGENGTGKSTLVEALAVACGFNPESGSRAFRFATRASESSLAEHLVVSWRPGRRPRTGFFLRAESFYNVATEIERLDADPDSPPLLAVPGARLLQIEENGAITEVSYDEAMPVAVTRAFVADPGRFLHHLLTDE